MSYYRKLDKLLTDAFMHLLYKGKPWPKCLDLCMTEWANDQGVRTSHTATRLNRLKYLSPHVIFKFNNNNLCCFVESIHFQKIGKESTICTRVQVSNTSFNLSL